MGGEGGLGGAREANVDGELPDFLHEVRPGGRVLQGGLQAEEVGGGEGSQPGLEESEVGTPNKREKGSTGHAIWIEYVEGG
jgi:hypothetical protein